jgi:hypothetical protein
MFSRTHAYESLGLPIDIGGGTIRREPGDIRALCRSAVAAAKLDHPDRWISHRLHRVGDGAGYWDTDLVHQLLCALLEHALLRGSLHAPVALAWNGTDEHVVVEVEYQPRSSSRIPAHLEDDAVDVREGGLGPAVAAAIAGAHGGTTEVARTPWGSVRWTVHLPRALRRAARRAKTDLAQAGEGVPA